VCRLAHCSPSLAQRGEGVSDDNRRYHQARASVYRLLSTLYYEPNEEFSPLLGNLESWLNEFDSQLVPLVRGMREDLNGGEGGTEDMTGLLVDYAKLFVGPFDLLAPPYGSVYLDEGRRVMGDSTMDVCAQYQRAGLEVAAGFKEAPDHITVELEFMYYLIHKHLHTDDALYRELQATFLCEHLGSWVEPFTKAMEENASRGFYRNLAHLTRLFIKAELDAVAAG